MQHTQQGNHFLRQKQHCPSAERVVAGHNPEGGARVLVNNSCDSHASCLSSSKSRSVPQCFSPTGSTAACSFRPPTCPCCQSVAPCCWTCQHMTGTQHMLGGTVIALEGAASKAWCVLVYQDQSAAGRPDPQHVACMWHRKHRGVWWCVTLHPRRLGGQLSTMVSYTEPMRLNPRRPTCACLWMHSSHASPDPFPCPCPCSCFCSCCACDLLLHHWHGHHYHHHHLLPAGLRHHHWLALLLHHPHRHLASLAAHHHPRLHPAPQHSLHPCLWMLIWRLLLYRLHPQNPPA